MQDLIRRCVLRRLIWPVSHKMDTRLKWVCKCKIQFATLTFATKSFKAAEGNLFFQVSGKFQHFQGRGQLLSGCWGLGVSYVILLNLWFPRSVGPDPPLDPPLHCDPTLCFLYDIVSDLWMLDNILYSYLVGISDSALFDFDVSSTIVKRPCLFIWSCMTFAIMS